MGRCDLRVLSSLLSSALVVGVGASSVFVSEARAADCGGIQGDFCAGSCPVKLAWPWDGAWCAGGARNAGGAAYHKEGRCGWVGRGDFIGAYACMLGNISIPIAGCQVSVADIGGGFNCIKGKVEAELRSRLSMNIAGCNVSIADIPGGFACLKNKVESELKSRLALDIFGCRVSIADPAGSFNCLKDKAVDEFKKGIGGLLALIEKAKPILECTGIADILDLATRFFQNPGQAIKQTWDNVAGFVTTAASTIFRDGQQVLIEVLNLMTGTSVTQAAMDKIMAFLWTIGEKAASFSGPARCLMTAMKQHQSTLEPIVRGIVQAVVDLVPTVSNLAQKAIADGAAGLIDKVLNKLLGEEKTKIVKGFFQKAFGPEAIQEEAARRVDAAILAMRKRAPNAAQAWQHARVLVSGTSDDFGVRKVLAHLQVAIEQAAMMVIELVVDEVAKWATRLGDTAVPNVANRVIDALCGLIPEAGAAICTFTASLAIRLIWNIIGAEAVQRLVKAALMAIAKHVVKPIVNKVAGKTIQFFIRKGSDWINQKVGGELNAATQGSPVAAWASRLVSPVVNFFIRIIQQWAVPNAQGAAAYGHKLAELGDLALAFAQGKAPPPQTPAPLINTALPPLEAAPPRLPTTGGAGPASASAGGSAIHWKTFTGQLIHCGVVGRPGYATQPACRIKDGPGCDTSIGQCSFPKAQARALCAAHPRCRGLTCAGGRSDCQARDEEESRNPIGNPAYDSQVALSWSTRGGQLIHCGVKGEAGYATLAGCRIKRGPGCGSRSGQCDFPKSKARELCLAHPQCVAVTCSVGNPDCQARDADEARATVPHNSYTSHIAR